VSGEGGGNVGQKLLVGVLGSPLGTWGWNSNSGGSSTVVSSLFTRKGSEGTGGRWKDVIKLPFLSFFSLFFLPFRYNMPFLCPHVTHQLSRVRLCQALPASICQALPASPQSTTGQTTVRLCQAQSSLTLDHSPSFLRYHSCHSPSRSMSLSFAISLSHSVA